MQLLSKLFPSQQHVIKFKKKKKKKWGNNEVNNVGFQSSKWNKFIAQQFQQLTGLPLVGLSLIEGTFSDFNCTLKTAHEQVLFCLSDVREINLCTLQ